MPTDLISIAEAARIMYCDRKTVEARMRQGLLTRYSFGPRSTRVSRSELESLLTRSR